VNLFPPFKVFRQCKIMCHTNFTDFKTSEVFSESSALQAIQTANLIESTPSNLRGEVKHLPCGLHVKQPAHNVQLLATHGRNQRPRTLGCAVPNDQKNKAERGSSHALADDHNEHSEDPDVEALASSLSSQADFYPSSEYPGNRGPLLHKLKAVHLHVLASEQCNASRLELCHRYI